MLPACIVTKLGLHFHANNLKNQIVPTKNSIPAVTSGRQRPHLGAGAAWTSRPATRDKGLHCCVSGGDGYARSRELSCGCGHIASLRYLGDGDLGGRNRVRQPLPLPLGDGSLGSQS